MSRPFFLVSSLARPALAAAFLAAGILTAAPALGQEPARIELSDRATVILADTDLTNSVSVSDPKFRKRGAITEAQFTIQSLRNEPVALEYQIQWLDQDGFEIRGPSLAWQVFRLEAGGSDSIQSMGRSPDAHSIRATIRYARS